MIEYANGDWVQWDATNLTYIGSVGGVAFGKPAQFPTAQDWVNGSGMALGLNDCEQLGLEKLSWAIGGLLPPNITSKTKFIARLTAAEWVGVTASTDPLVVWWLAQGVNADTIDRNDPRTAQGLNMLLSKGLLAVGRPAEIMAW